MYQETAKISTVIAKEQDLETIISQLLAESVARSDISIQGSSDEIKKRYGVEGLDPHIIQNSEAPPTTAPFLADDFGWLVGFSFSLPLAICLILGVFVFGDVRSDANVFIHGSISAVVGIILGLLIAYCVKTQRQKRLKHQEKMGGFVLWVVTHSKAQTKQVLRIFKAHRLFYKKHKM